MKVISNTTVISNFAAIAQLDMLHRIYGELYLSVQAYDEILFGLEEGYQFYRGIEQYIAPLVPNGWIRLTSLEDAGEFQLFGEMPARLHQGEASTLAIAHQRGWGILTDDRAARAEAVRMGIPLSGSIGSLILAVDRGLCSLEEANDWLAEMIQHGYRAPVTDLAPYVNE